MSTLPPAIFVMGPTASGKTDLAISLFQQLPVELISVDSALVYRDMNIGTAKPDAATLQQFPHHLVDIIDPTQSYSAAMFRQTTLNLMQDIRSRGKIPLLVGGTMLYFKALREGLSELPETVPEIRNAINAEIAEHGIAWLHQQLSLVDPTTAQRLNVSDTQRIQRAMEIYRISGRTMSELLAQQTEQALPYQVIPLALIPSDRSQLHTRINLRFENMLQQGLLGELTQLQQKYALQADLPSMRCVGYRQAWQYLSGEIDRQQLIDTGCAATRQLAKRQMTWLRSMPDIIELDCLAPQLHRNALDIIKQQLAL